MSPAGRLTTCLLHVGRTSDWHECKTKAEQSPRWIWRVEGKVDGVSAQFLWFQISTFDKSSIPTLTHSRMEIAALSFPLYPYLPLQPYYQDEQGQEHKDIF